MARMMILEGHRLGLEMHVLCSSATEPAAQVTSHVHIGSIDDLACLKGFLNSVDAVTFESEFVNTNTVKACLPQGLHFFPNLNAIESIQDRSTQKALLDQFKIPTAPWMNVDSFEDLKSASQQFKNGYVLKKRRFGYDGNGTFVIKKLSSEHQKLIQDSNAGFIAEELIAFKSELAVVVAAAKKQTHFLPLVETKQVDSRCLWVKGPVKNRHFNALIKPILKMLRALDYQGVLAFELFETSKGLLVNELAPRVHNSGHYSQDALAMSQFELHLRAGLMAELPKVRPLAKGFAMYNLLGEGNSTIKLSSKPLGGLHWYGKDLNKLGRKLGHINTLGDSPQDALKKAVQWRKDFKL